MNYRIIGSLPSPDEKEMAEFRQATRQLYDLKERAFAEADAELVVSGFYAENAIAVGPDGQAHEGRDALRGIYQRMVRDKRVRIESWQSYVHGNAGWDWTNFHIMPNDPARAPSSSIILFLWARNEQGWLCAGDIYVPGERPL